jgi:hypothetical protein
VSSQGPFTAGTIANVATGNVAWSSPSNATTTNQVYATSSLVTSGPQTSQYLEWTNFGFTIPAGTINGIVVTIIDNGTSDANNTIEDNLVSLIVGGSITGSNKATATTWPSTDQTVVYGTSSDLWGLTPTVSQINASNFGVVLQAQSLNSKDGTTTLTASVDSATIQVFYTAAAGGMAVQFGLIDVGNKSERSSLIYPTQAMKPFGY